MRCALLSLTSTQEPQVFLCELFNPRACSDLTYTNQCVLLKCFRGIRNLCALPEAVEHAKVVTEALNTCVEVLARSTLETLEECVETRIHSNTGMRVALSC